MQIMIANNDKEILEIKFKVNVEQRRGFRMSGWLFNICINGAVRVKLQSTGKKSGFSE